MITGRGIRVRLSRVLTSGLSRGLRVRLGLMTAGGLHVRICAGYQRGLGRVSGADGGGRFRAYRRGITG
ncbi:hypothetical protein GCM10009765_01060 [Fodinicola feengrottensis]|uniref:DUF4236 domain-containing protein n=1 Tax=Fodinicola feengrottensis TaxID=435914 RepID=A0ABN2FQ11_9ACTN